MTEQQVTHILEEIAEQAVPAHLDLWPSIRARLQPEQRPSRWAHALPATRLGWAFLILTLFLAFGAAVYAVAPILSRVFQMEAGLQYVEQANLGQEVDLSQTIDGITVTLQRVYADANRIVVGYSVKGPEYLPDNHTLGPARVTLTDAAGIVFPESVGYGVTGQSDILQVSLRPREGVYVSTFDASSVEGEPAALDLHLVMDVETNVVPTPVPPTPGVYADRGPLEPVTPVARTGPFTFDFSLPFIPGRTLELQRTVEAAGIAVRLERVVVTPSETRAILCFDPPDGKSEEWLPVVTLSTAGRKAYIAGPGAEQIYNLNGSAITTVGRIGEGTCYRYSVLAPLDDQSGEWMLTVTELVGFDPGYKPGEQKRLAGPWVFRFRLP